MLAGAGALAAALLAGRQIRLAALRTSHQQPTPERWYERAPPTSPALANQGRTLFLSSCAHCHGTDASGGEGPDLRELQVSDRYIANTIRQGIKGEMPSFARKHNDADIAALLAYVRSLPAP